MPSVTSFLNNPQLNKTPEVIAIKKYIKDNILKYFKIDKTKMEPAYDLDQFLIDNALAGNVADCVVYDVVLKKKNLKYSPKMFVKEIRFTEHFYKEFCNLVGSNIDIDISTFFYKEMGEILKNKNQEYESIPIKHFLLFARASQWYRCAQEHHRIFFIQSYDKFQSDMDDLKTLIPVMESRISNIFKNLDIQDYSLGHTLGDIIVKGDCDILLDDKIIDNKSTKNMSMTTDWLFQMLFYIYLHHEKKNLKGHPHRIKNIGFMNWRCNHLHMKPYDMTKELISLFDNLYSWTKRCIYK